MNIRSLSTGGLPARDLIAVRMGASSAHASSVSNKRTDIRFPLACIVMNGREKTYPGIMNSSTRPRSCRAVCAALDVATVFYVLARHDSEVLRPWSAVRSKQEILSEED